MNRPGTMRMILTVIAEAAGFVLLMGGCIFIATAGG